MILKKTITITFVVIFLSALTGFNYRTGGDKIPQGWFKAGTKPNSYEIGIMKKGGKSGENAVYIKSIKKDVYGFGTMMQDFSADKYLGKRVMFSGYIKSKDVKESAALWMRIDGAGNPPKVLGMDNMFNRPIKGNTDWKKYDIVLDVPSGSKSVNIGVMISGTGEIWISGLRFKVVGKNVPTTNLIDSYQEAKKPVNLDFGK